MRSPRLFELARRPHGIGRFLLRRPHDPDYAVFALFPERRGLFLDIGAYTGISALSFRIYRRENPILSIEPNPHHERYLRSVKRLIRNFDYMMCAAGSENGTLQLHVPLYRGVPLAAYAASGTFDIATEHEGLRRRLGSRMDSPDFKIVSQDVPVRRLDDLHVRPDFIKVDVEGHEFEVLTGLRETLSDAHPVLLMEAPDADSRALLLELGFRAFMFDRTSNSLQPQDGGANVNTVFLHQSAGSSR